MLHHFTRAADKKKLTFLQYAADSVGRTTYTFTSQNLGTVTNDRVIIVCAFGSSALSINLNSVTLGGIAMTSVVSTGSTNAPTAIYRITSTSGTTADVVVTFSSGSTRCAIAMYSLTGFGTVITHDTASTLATTATLSNTIDTTYNSVIIGYGSQFVSGGGPLISSFAGFTTKDVDAIPDTDSRVFAGSSGFTPEATNATYSVTFNNTSSQPSTLVSAAFSYAGVVRTSLLLHFDGANASTTFTDSSPFGLSVTAGGNAQLSTAQFKFGTASAVFDGSGDSLQLPSDNALNFGIAPFTVEFWMRTNGTQDLFSSIVSRYSNAPSTGGTQTFGIINRNNNEGGNFIVNINGTIRISWAPTVNDGLWHHVAVSRQGVNLYLGVDGTIVASSSSLSGSESVSISSGRIGRSQINDLTDNNYNGYLDEFRVTKGLALYTTTYTVPTAEF